jgi:sulfonate transport system ATP-binding protein
MDESKTAALGLTVERKLFDGRTVLENLSLELGRGEIVVIVGPSGCGKSTLLRIAMGLERDFIGEVRLSGKPTSAGTGACGLIFQEPRLLPWLSVVDNVAFAAGGGAGAMPRALSLLDEVGLQNSAGLFPKELSGGMAQRVSLARGLYCNPEILLLDEPFSAVDALTRMKLQDLLLHIAKAHGISILLVTHDVEEAIYLADRVLVMSAYPGTIRGEVKVSARRPRSRTSPDLLDLHATVIAELEEAHAL